MGIRNNRIERTMRRAMGGRLDGMGGGSPASRTHRPHLKGGAAQARGLGAAVRPKPAEPRRDAARPPEDREPAAPGDPPLNAHPEIPQRAPHGRAGPWRAALFGCAPRTARPQAPPARRGYAPPSPGRFMRTMSAVPSAVTWPSCRISPDTKTLRRSVPLTRAVISRGASSGVGLR